MLRLVVSLSADRVIKSTLKTSLPLDNNSSSASIFYFFVNGIVSTEICLLNL